jgi:hypothetical protein
MGLKAISLEGGLSKSEALSAFAVGDDLSKTLFDKDLQGRPIAVGHLPRFFKQTIRDLYGCLHMPRYIVMYGNMSNKKTILVKDTNSSTLLTLSLRAKQSHI